MPVKEVSARELLGGHSAAVMPGSPQFARLKKLHEDQAAARRDTPDADPQPDPAPPAD